jgi:hypothetical protein
MARFSGGNGVGAVITVSSCLSVSAIIVRFGDALSVPGMIRIVWPAKYITALAHPIRLTELLGAGFLVVMGRAQAGELIEG